VDLFLERVAKDHGKTAVWLRSLALVLADVGLLDWARQALEHADRLTSTTLELIEDTPVRGIPLDEK
jgi:hypothetical protein